MAQKYIVGDIVMYHNKIMVVKEPRDGRHFDLSCPKEGLVYDLVDIEEIKPVRYSRDSREEWMDALSPVLLVCRKRMFEVAFVRI